MTITNSNDTNTSKWTDVPVSRITVSDYGKTVRIGNRVGNLVALKRSPDYSIRRFVIEIEEFDGNHAGMITQHPFYANDETLAIYNR